MRRRRPYADRLGTYVRLAALANAGERQEGTLEEIASRLRARLATEDSTARPEEIEARVERILAAGMKPTPGEPKPKEPASTTAATSRRAARKALVRQGRHLRRQ